MMIKFKCIVVIFATLTIAQFIAATQVACDSQATISDIPKWHVIVSTLEPTEESPACGGTLLNDRFVITAAHCLFDLAGNPFKPSNLKVIYNTGMSNQTTVRVIKTYLAEGFDINKFDNGIALIKSMQPIVLSFHARPICFPSTPKFLFSGDIIVPLPINNNSNLVMVSLKATKWRACDEINYYIFGSTYKSNMCFGSLTRTDKFQINRGSGLLMIENGVWHLVGILLYTVGPNESRPTYGGGIVTWPYAGWISKVASRHINPTISETKCRNYSQLSAKSNNSFNPTIRLLERYWSLSPSCYGTLISERFILTAAKCAQSTDSITLQHSIMEFDTETYQRFQFHFHPKDKNHDGIALVELPKEPTYMKYYIHCLWTEEDQPYNFVTSLFHSTLVGPLKNVNVHYTPGGEVSMRLGDECNNYTIQHQTRPGDTLAFQKEGENIKYVVGVINRQLTDCYRNDVDVLNIFNYLDWIENIVWGNRSSNRNS